MDTEGLQGAGLAFRLDTESKVLLASVTPVAAAPSIDEAWLREELLTQGYGQLRYQPAAATILLANYHAGTAIQLILAKCIDASLHLHFSADDLEAYLDINPAEGGAPIDEAAVFAALAENGIGEGILPEAIDAAVAAGSAKDQVIVRGLAPVHGQDGYLESLIPEVRERVPRVDETGHTDYRDLGEIQVVHMGDDLMLRHPASAGIPGRTIHGKSIAARNGKEVLFASNLPGTSFAPDNLNLLQAAITGQPLIIRGGMMVEPVYKVPAVDTSSGNIDFDGSVVIDGDVSTGMTVRASGDIQVGGVVEIATLEAGGCIVIKGGLLGSLGRKTSTAEKHHVRCTGSFNAMYAQQASIEAGDSIFINDMAMQCELSAIKHICIGNDKRGHIIGGHIQATLSITARQFGSPNRVHTLCEIGVNPLMQKQLLGMCKKRDTKETQLLEVSKLLDLASKNPGKLPAEMIDKARATAAALAADIAALREEQDLLTQMIALSQQARVVAQQAIYEGVEVQLGNLRYRVAGEHGPCYVGLSQRGLELLALE